MPKKRTWKDVNRIKKAKRQEEAALDRKNAYGNTDPTPYQAVKRIIKQERQAAHSA